MEGDDVGGQTLDPVLNKVYDTWYYNVEPKYDSSYKTRFKPVKFETIGNVGKTDPTTGKVLPKYAYEIFEADKLFCLPYYSECVGTLKSGDVFAITYSMGSTITYQKSVETTLSSMIANSGKLGLKIDVLNFGYSINSEIKSTVSSALSITETKQTHQQYHIITILVKMVFIMFNKEDYLNYMKRYHMKLFMMRQIFIIMPNIN